MKTNLYGLLAETAIHPGAGQDAGLIDLPVARERITDFPVVVGSSLKGALRDQLFWQDYKDPTSQPGFSQLDEEQQHHQKADSRRQVDRTLAPIFGAQGNESAGAGGILVSDARLLLLPIRSLTSHYYWITCPLILERFVRDHKRANFGDVDIPALTLSPQQFAGLTTDDSPAMIFLEELQFARNADHDQENTTSVKAAIELIRPLIRHAATAQRLESQLVILCDEDFTWFARYGLTVTARNVLDRETKASKNLWYEETLPSDSLFYFSVSERNSGTLSDFDDRFCRSHYLQVGGNETVGQGWFVTQRVDFNQ